MKHLLIVGRSGIGKTTLMQKLIRSLRGRLIEGFITEELREKNQRVGFWLSSLDGRQILLAHKKNENGYRVGPYKVNTGVLNQVAVPIIKNATKKASVIFIDELGKMELSSSLFGKAVLEAFNRSACIVATAGINSIPFVSKLKRRKDVELIPLTQANRNSVAEELIERLSALCAEDEAIKNIQRKADRISEMIIAGDIPQIDIQIQQAALREAVIERFPNRESLYQILFESRFRRLWQQFRSHDSV